MKHHQSTQKATTQPPEEEVLSSLLPTVRTVFVCESCEYRWEAQVETVVEDAYTDAEAVHRAVRRVSCPICGSHDINLYED